MVIIIKATVVKFGSIVPFPAANPKNSGSGYGPFSHNLVLLFHAKYAKA